MAVLVLFGAALLAAAPTPLKWIPLASPAPAKARMQVIRSDAASLVLSVMTPGIQPAARSVAGNLFATLSVPGCGILTGVGEPALPVLRRLAIVPAGATVSCTCSGAPTTLDLPALGLPPLVMPAQAPVPKTPGALEAAVFNKDAAIYGSTDPFPASPVTIVEAGTVCGRRLVSVEVCPLLLAPATGQVTAYADLTITLTFGKNTAGVTALSSEALTAQEHALLAGIVLNPPAGNTVMSSQNRLLVIAPDSWTNSLAAFASHKSGQGWLVDCFGTNSTGRTKDVIQAFVVGRYTNISTRPSALLLVGDTLQIAAFRGLYTDHPITDLYYGCMDGGTDWQPEFPVGRFCVSTLAELTNVTAKSIAHEQARVSGWFKRATFMASKDNYAITEGTHESVIADHLVQRGYASSKLYCQTYAATGSQVFSAFNSGCAFGVYSGHGMEYYWADGPVFSADDVMTLANTGHYTVVFSFACLTGDYSYLPYCLAEAWLRAPGRGAAAVLASSVTSYWNEDDILEKALFNALFGENQPLLGTAFWRARQLFLAYWGDDPFRTTRRYYEQYNLLGDPTLRVAGLPGQTNGIPDAWFTQHGITNTDYTLELEADRDGDGMTAFQEYQAGTDPGNASSALRLQAALSGDGRLTLSWPDGETLFYPEPYYAIWVRTNLVSGRWLPQTNIAVHTLPTNEVQLVIPPATPELFYRVTLTN